MTISKLTATGTISAKLNPVGTISRLTAPGSFLGTVAGRIRHSMTMVAVAIVPGLVSAPVRHTVTATAAATVPATLTTGIVHSAAVGGELVSRPMLTLDGEALTLGGEALTMGGED